MLDKKAQIGETITWVVATLIIVVVLLISIFIASGSDTAKKIIGIEKNAQYSRESDRAVGKSFFSYLLTKESGESVYSSLQKPPEINNFNGNLAVKIFKELHKEDYLKQIWFGINLKPNDFFNSYAPPTHTRFFIKKIKLNSKDEAMLMVAYD